jgi:hypothetical protein
MANTKKHKILLRKHKSLRKELKQFKNKFDFFIKERIQFASSPQTEASYRIVENFFENHFPHCP